MVQWDITTIYRLICLMIFHFAHVISAWHIYNNTYIFICKRTRSDHLQLSRWYLFVKINAFVGLAYLAYLLQNVLDCFLVQ